jgi:hypothetical protein
MDPAYSTQKEAAVEIREVAVDHSATRAARPLALQDLDFPPSDDEEMHTTYLEGIEMDDLDADTEDEDENIMCM